MKRIMCFVVCLILISVLTGCVSTGPSIKSTDRATIIIQQDSVMTQDYRNTLCKSFTVITKVKLDKLPSESEAKILRIYGGHSLAGQQGSGAALSFYKGNDRLFFDTYNGTARNAAISEFSKWEPGVSYVITAVNDQDNGEKQLYINSVLDSESKTFTNDVYWAEKVPFEVDYGKYPYLEIGDVYIFDKVLNSNEVARISAEMME